VSLSDLGALRQYKATSLVAGYPPDELISRIECGSARPYLDTVADLAAALRIDMELLVAEVT